MASPRLRSLLRKLSRTRSQKNSEEEPIPLNLCGSRNKPLPPLPHEIDPGSGKDQDFTNTTSLGYRVESSHESARHQITPNFSRQFRSNVTTDVTVTNRPRRLSIDRRTDLHPDDIFVDSSSVIKDLRSNTQDEHSIGYAITTPESHNREEDDEADANKLHDYRNGESIWFASSLERPCHDNDPNYDSISDKPSEYQEIDSDPESFQVSPDLSGDDDTGTMNLDPESNTRCQSNRHSGNDFFTKYFDAMEHGTEHSWTAALCQSDLSDQALADAYLNNLPANTLQRHLHNSETRASSSSPSSSSAAAAMDSHQALYTFGSSPKSYTCQPGLRARKTNPPKIEMPYREAHSIVPQQLSPICEERESIASLPPLAETQVSSPSTPTSSKVKRFSNCDSCGSSSPTHYTPCRKLENGEYSCKQRQTLLLKVLAAAATQVSPFHFVYKSFRTYEPAVHAHYETVQCGSASPARYVRSKLSLCNALRAVTKTVRDYKNSTASVRLDENGLPISKSALYISIGGVALVAASVLALEAAASDAEDGVDQDRGLILAAKNAGAESHEFCNRVFDVLAIFRVTDSRQSHKAQGVCLRVLEVCANAVDDAMWKLWEQMHGGIDESGQRMSDSVHWDIMIEVAREAISMGFIDIGRLKPMCEAIEMAASLEWMHG